MSAIFCQICLQPEHECGCVMGLNIKDYDANDPVEKDPILATKGPWLTDPLVSPWQPMTKAIDIKHIGKLQEELGELNAALARCLIQGIDECEPVTGKSNRDWLEEEIADVRAGLDLLDEHFKLMRLTGREAEKKERLRKWHGMLASPISKEPSDRLREIWEGA